MKDYATYDDDSCQKGIYKDTNIDVYYCATGILYIHKCCDRGRNINLKGATCTDHLAEADENGSLFIQKLRNHGHLPNLTVDPTLFDGKIYSMAKDKYLSVTNGNNNFSLDGTELHYKGRVFQEVSMQVSKTF